MTAFHAERRGFRRAARKDIASVHRAKAAGTFYSGAQDIP